MFVQTELRPAGEATPVEHGQLTLSAAIMAGLKMPNVAECRQCYLVQGPVPLTDFLEDRVYACALGMAALGAGFKPTRGGNSYRVHRFLAEQFPHISERTLRECSISHSTDGLTALQIASTLEARGL